MASAKAKTRKKTASDFKPILVQRELTVSGGLLKKPMAVRALDVKHGDANRSRTFVHLHSNLDWLCLAVAGTSHGCHPLKRVTLLVELFDEAVTKLQKEKQQKKEGSQVDEEPAILGEGGADEAEQDSLEAAEPWEDAPVSAERKKPDLPAKKQKKKEHREVQVTMLTMPATAPEVDPEQGLKRSVAVMIRINKEVWLDSADVPWALAYMHDQWRLCGVPAVRSKKRVCSRASELAAAAGTPSEESTEPPTPHWDWSRQCWKVTVATATQPKVRVLTPEQLTLEEAAAVRPDVETLEGLEYQAIKDLSFAVMCRWARQQCVGERGEQ